MPPYVVLLYPAHSFFWSNLTASFAASPTELLINWMNGWSICPLHYAQPRHMPPPVIGRRTIQLVTSLEDAVSGKSVANPPQCVISFSPRTSSNSRRPIDGTH